MTKHPGKRPKKVTLARMLLRSTWSRGAELAGLLVASGMVCSGLVLALPASAADMVYWGNYDGSAISFAKLDGSGGGDLITTSGDPDGLAIDSATDKIYWVNHFTDKIFFANLDGSGSGSLTTTGVTPESPMGLAIDPATEEIYWGNEGNSTISFAKLDGSGGGTLNTAPVAPVTPIGVAVDPETGKIYWANYEGNTISFANLNDTGGGGTLNTSGATMDEPDGVAIDPEAGKLYWGNFLTDKISFANLNDTGGGGTLNTSGATPNEPNGLAVDSETGKLYWANKDTISFANLNDTGGGGTLNTSGATMNGADFPLLLNVPSGTGVPVISGAPTVGSVLSCSPGAWAPDLVPAFDYLAPQGFAYGWSENGTAIAGASASSLTASTAGSYSCQVTASNQAGASAQSSAAFTVSAASQPAPTTTTTAATATTTQPSSDFSAVGNPSIDPKTGAITFTETVSDPGTFKWTLSFQNGKFGVFTATNKPSCKAAQVRLEGRCRPATIVFGTGTESVASPGRVSFTVKPSFSALKALRRALEQKRGIHITAVLSYRSALGGSHVSHTVTVEDKLRSTKKTGKK